MDPRSLSSLLRTGKVSTHAFIPAFSLAEREEGRGESDDGEGEAEEAYGKGDCGEDRCGDNEPWGGLAGMVDRKRLDKVDSSLRRGRGLLLRSGSSSSKRMEVTEMRTGELLLGLVNRGLALVAELLRLSQHVPAVLQQSPADSGGKYAALLFDFKHFKSPKVYEEQVEASLAFTMLDDEFREACGNVVERFFLLSDGIAKYYKDLSRFMDDLLQVGVGAFLQQTAETVLENEEGWQLLMEALMLHGVYCFCWSIGCRGACESSFWWRTVGVEVLVIF